MYRMFLVALCCVSVWFGVQKMQGRWVEDEKATLDAAQASRTGLANRRRSPASFVVVRGRHDISRYLHPTLPTVFLFGPEQG